MTWSYWRISPFVTSIFFILGVLTLYWVLFNWITSWFHARHINIDDDTINAWHGVIYMLVFVFVMQLSVIGQANSWEFVNFHLIAVIFCAFFLNIRMPYYTLLPVVIVYMVFDQSIFFWESWSYAAVFVGFFWSLNYLRLWVQKHAHSWVYYYGTVGFFGGVLWGLIKVKYSLSWENTLQEYGYLLIFAGLLYAYVNMLTQDSEIKLRLAQFASHDALTQTENFAAYTEHIKYLFDDSTANNLNLSMMMFDIDHFKHVNDTYGHLAGDRVLQEVSETVQTVLSENDPKVKLYRTGGEEFNVLFPGYDLVSTRAIVRQIFAAVNHLVVKYGDQEIAVSISVGVSTLHQADDSPVDFYNRVDQNLYFSKRHGRMRVTVDQ
ncbi:MULTISPECIES: GGDEF domain-containing protein [Lactiplantibacillus]|jgi:diguanylate cyclase (GGDEF)-like protein|uniref:GGDEF domain-containing protein n=4 Tax=Lactiplantibacillus pentosus TaxID=1589 RepID=A0A2I0Z4G1_LACPE|nr:MULTISPECIES: GGDEF domain-containing protein [Lactiplantibacillus]MCH4129027.1 GGDEF domain-containing protein [Lactiplantibacillus sp.]CCC17711.1 protein containing diguanylate cyclase/phosphodiesterase domain 1 (GGDEF) [Lactiplantibacillus pentosus IG1]BBM22419.1 diguanylate cyclase/phosphodiesterase domain-containing protein [Lactiplantibacillus plantarum]AUI77775.1 diguanylate cyclase [Lactiplantibacillus pentosus]AYG38265.1 GGDEF domain-containing protein [Lactiplantibacillus pentosus